MTSLARLYTYKKLVCIAITTRKLLLGVGMDGMSVKHYVYGVRANFGFFSGLSSRGYPTVTMTSCPYIFE